MISNYIKLFSGGGNSDNQKEFTYEGGNKLYHFSPNDNGLSRYMDLNVVFFANSAEHATDVLIRMLKFVLECHKEQSAYYRGKGSKQQHSEEFHDNLKGHAKEITTYLEAVVSGKAKVTEAPMNQFYKVGWASNDTIQ